MFFKTFCSTLYSRIGGLENSFFDVTNRLTEALKSPTSKYYLDVLKPRTFAYSTSIWIFWEKSTKNIFTWEGSSATIHRCCLEKKTSLQATNDRRGDYPKKNLPDARLFSSLFLASPFRFFIVSGFPYVFLIKLYFNCASTKKRDKFRIPRNKLDTKRLKKSWIS